MSDAPLTWDEMRAFGEPTLPRDACAICRAIPDRCGYYEKGGEISDDRPPEVQQLVGVGLPDLADDDVQILRCPTCHGFYRYQHSPYEYLAWGSEESTSYTRLVARDLFHSYWFTRYRVADPRIGRALDAIVPGALANRDVIDFADQTFFPEHCFARVAIADRRLWIALADDAQVTALSEAALAQLVATHPPHGLDQRAAAYAELADRVTSEHDVLRVESFDRIPWRRELTAEDRAYIEELRGASRVEPVHVDQLADRVVVRSWVVTQRQLICRVMTVWPSGVVRREDAVIGAAIPTD